MSFDGIGIYSLPTPEYPAIAGEYILAASFNTIMEDIAAALTEVNTTAIALEALFPGLAGEVTATENELNLLDGASFSAAELEAVITAFAGKTFSSTDDVIDNFPAGTALSFFQASAPSGWVQNTSNNDAFLRVVSGAGGGTGGSASAATLAHIHAMSTHYHTMNTHNHKVYDYVGATSAAQVYNSSGSLTALTYGAQSNSANIASPTAGVAISIDLYSSNTDPGNTNSTDPGDTNSTSINPKYINVIVAVKA